jgi:hypothetical protein
MEREEEVRIWRWNGESVVIECVPLELYDGR